MKDHKEALNQDNDVKKHQAGQSNMPAAAQPNITDDRVMEGPQKTSEAGNYADLDGRGDVGSEYAAADPDKGNKGSVPIEPYSKNNNPQDADMADSFMKAEGID